MKRGYRIGIVTRWGAACGISLHGELIARALLSMGHEVRVYAPTLETAGRDWHHVLIEGDPPWVQRVYGEVDEVEYPEGGYFRRPSDWDENDVIIVEGYHRLPWRALEPHVREVKRRGTATILVVHYAFPRDLEPVLEDPSLWDVVAVFDERFVGMVERVAGKRARVEIVPYPYMVLEVDYADRPSYAEGKVLLFSFGRQPPHEYVDYLRGIARLVKRKYPLVYRVVRSLGTIGYQADWLVVEHRKLSVKELYSALKGADIHLIPKWDHPGIVVSSTLAQVLYAGVATIVPDTRYFETIPDGLEESGPVIKYRLGDVTDLVSRLELLIKDEGLRRELGRRAKRYAWERRAEVVAEKLLSSI
ncbi:glycosyltransferase family 4 protein [Pyrolobus fumarii]|uniref:glycosyltransferase family 4 protein n=1 Tax=Pyrolobus fumarii TaxID=54252 RepID=UPI001433074F|nr:glycosyltransferase family 4 protein [Pyrolobus fumarii]